MFHTFIIFYLVILPRPNPSIQIQEYHCTTGCAVNPSSTCLLDLLAQAHPETRRNSRHGLIKVKLQKFFPSKIFIEHTTPAPTATQFRTFFSRTHRALTSLTWSGPMNVKDGDDSPSFPSGPRQSTDSSPAQTTLSCNKDIQRLYMSMYDSVCRFCWSLSRLARFASECFSCKPLSSLRAYGYLTLRLPQYVNFLYVLQACGFGLSVRVTEESKTTSTTGFSSFKAAVGGETFCF